MGAARSCPTAASARCRPRRRRRSRRAMSCWCRRSPRPAKGAAQFALDQIPEVSGGLVALDPHTGRVLAEVGGFSYAISQFDRATQAQRQTGSAIKPFVYLAALDHGFTPSTMVLDGPLVVDQGPGLPKWNPTNYEHKFFGPGAAARRARGIAQPRHRARRHGDRRRHGRRVSQALRHRRSRAARICDADRRRDDDPAQAHHRLCHARQWRQAHHARPSSTACRTATAAPSTAPTTAPATAAATSPMTASRRPSCPTTREQIADPRSAYQVVAMMEGVIQRGTGRSDRLARPPACRQDRHHQRIRTTPGSWASRPTSCAASSSASTSPRASASARPAPPSRRRPSRISWRTRSRTSRPFRSAFRPASTWCGSTPAPASSRSARRPERHLRAVQARHRAERQDRCGVVLDGGEAGPTAGTVPVSAEAPAERGIRRAVAGAASPRRRAQLPPPAPAAYIETRRHRRSFLMRAEIEAAADEIRRSLALLRRHL